MAFSCDVIRPLTVPAVPTGMKQGSSRTPRGVVRRLNRAPQCLSTWSNSYLKLTCSGMLLRANNRSVCIQDYIDRLVGYSKPRSSIQDVSDRKIDGIDRTSQIGQRVRCLSSRKTQSDFSNGPNEIATLFDTAKND